MNKENPVIRDDKFRDLLAGTKISAGENLKHRIMQQIKTEKVLYPQKIIKNRTSLVSDMLTAFGVMCAIMVATGIGVFITADKNVLESITYLLPASLIVFVCSLFWMISVYDDQRNRQR
jgi:hypothetical protein